MKILVHVLESNKFLKTEKLGHFRIKQILGIFGRKQIFWKILEKFL
jgi:hypothetical protein